MKVLNYLLGYKNLKIYQDTNMFNFSLDSVLLSNFVTLNKNISNIMDIGTGNAVIPIILSTKTKAKIIGIEIQKDVSELAIESVKYNNLENQIQIINEDVKVSYIKYNSDSFDVITCNPPFFKIYNKSKINNSDYKTIARHEVCLNLDEIMKISSKLLKNNGVVAIVHRPERLVDIIMTMKKYNIEPKKIQYVYPKHDREANILLVEGRKNGKEGLEVLSPLYAHDEKGNYTKEIEKYFK